MNKETCQRKLFSFPKKNGILYLIEKSAAENAVYTLHAGNGGSNDKGKRS